MATPDSPRKDPPAGPPIVDPPAEPVTPPRRDPNPGPEIEDPPAESPPPGEPANPPIEDPPADPPQPGDPERGPMIVRALEAAGESRRDRIEYVCDALGPLYPTYVSGLVRLGHEEIVLRQCPAVR